jgi:predicted regulator of amino acid metabolism with ACT domain
MKIALENSKRQRDTARALMVQISALVIVIDHGIPHELLRRISGVKGIRGRGDSGVKQHVSCRSRNP